jgi:MinD-like ATPase involved in chromosome partitioning or flagellar assembly
MLGNPYILGVSSQKGGVGKTTVSVNLAAALKSFNYKILLIDSDTTNPSIGFHMGLEKANIGYRDVLYGKAELEDAIAVHGSTGLHVLPGTINSKHFSPSQANIDKLGMKIKKGNYDFVIFDTAPGFVEEDLSRYYDEALILTTPEMSAATSSIRLAHRYDEVGVKHNMVVNRIKNKRYEISIGEIEEIYDKKLRGAIPEDEVVPISVSEHIPAYVISPNSKFATNIRGVARKYASGDLRLTTLSDKGEGIVGFLKRLFRLR